MFFPMRLNLLPPDKQQNLHKTLVAQFIKNIFELGFFVTCIIAIALLGGQWILQTYFYDITTNTLSVSAGPNDTTRRINQVNTILRNAEAVQKGYISWTPILIEIHSALPGNVVLTRLVLDPKTEKAEIAGRAATRDDLLALEIALEALPFFGDIEVSLSQLTQRENIAFSFSPSFSL